MTEGGEREMDGRDLGREGRKEKTRQVHFVFNHQKKMFFHEIYGVILFLTINMHISLSRWKTLKTYFTLA